jgi:hypothetical protein
VWLVALRTQISLCVLRVASGHCGVPFSLAVCYMYHMTLRDCTAWHCMVLLVPLTGDGGDAAAAA